MKILGNKLISECTEYDFKQELERKKISHWLKSVSAYANSEGGALYYGVDNDGNVTGLANPPSDSDFISQKINAHLDPVPDWTLTPGEDEQGHKVLEVLVKPGQFTPYYLVLDGSRQAYVRSGNESVVASSRELLKLVLKGTNRSWDALPSRETVEKHSFKMLAHEYHERTLQPWDDKYPESWGLVLEDGTLTNGGLLFSDNCEVYQSRVFCTRWNGLTKTDAINDAEYSGNLLYLLKMMRGFIKSNTAKRWFKLPDYRLNFPEYADRAILECCVNHLIHRDMTEVGSEVHVDIYDDRIEFYSPGGMFDGTRIQDRDILKVPSKRRNPIIADVFTQLDYMEKRGSGFQKITELTSELRLFTEDRMPTFESDASSFFTTVHSVLYGRSDEDFQRVIDHESTPKEENTTQKTTQKAEDTTQKTNPKTENTTQKPVSDTAQKILDLLTEDPYLTRQDIAPLLNLTPDGVKYHLTRLQRLGYLLRIEGRKSGRWKVLVKK